eukprot:6125285-Prymnesium_polylepis.1
MGALRPRSNPFSTWLPSLFVGTKTDLTRPTSSLQPPRDSYVRRGECRGWHGSSAALCCGSLCCGCCG